jgi:phosphoglycolate phosphatase
MTEMVVFDFDGTLADTLEASRHIFNKLAPEYDLPPISQNDLQHLRSLTLSQFLKHLGIKNRHLPFILKKGRKLMKECITELAPCTGVLEELAGLREKVGPLGILTSNSAENVELFLQHHQVREHFDFISSIGKLRGKAKHLKSIARTFSLTPEDLSYVGDEIRDIRAAQKAGVNSIAVSWGFNNAEALQQAGPDHLLRIPSELKELNFG